MAEVNKMKKRSENFSVEELLFLVEEVEKYTNIIKSKQSNSVTNAKKAAAWQQITDAVNSRGGVTRTVDQIKEKYRKACSKAKSESIVQKQYRLKTGGGHPPPSVDAVTQKILDANYDAPNFFGIDGGIEVGGFIVTEMPETELVTFTDCDDKLDTCAEPQINSTAENTTADYSTTTTVELPDNLKGTSVTYDLVVSETGTEIKNQKKTDKVRKRKSEGSVEELQKLVLKEDLVRIQEETELIRTQKQKVALEIQKLKLEIALMQKENEM